MRKYVNKLILTLTLVSIGLICFTYSEKTITQEEYQILQSFKRTITTEKEGLKKFLEYIGLFLLVIAAWQWKKELGFDSFGFLSKQPDVKPTNPDDRDSSEGDTPPRIVISKSITNGKGYEFKHYNESENLERVLELMRENPNSITNASIIYHKLGLTKKSVQQYLFELMKKNLIRKDTYPGCKSSIYSLITSKDNLAVDYYIKNQLSAENIISDYRYIKYKNKFEIDSLIKTDKTNYLIEIKFIRKDVNNILNMGIRQLLRIEEEINIEPITLVLLIVGEKTDLKEIMIDKLLIKENLKIIKIKNEKLTMST